LFPRTFPKRRIPRQRAKQHSGQSANGRGPNGGHEDAGGAHHQDAKRVGGLFRGLIVLMAARAMFDIRVTLPFDHDDRALVPACGRCAARCRCKRLRIRPSACALENRLAVYNTSLRLAGERDTAGVLRKRRFRGLVVAVAWRRQTCADDPSTLIIDVLVPIDFTWGVPPAVHARADFRSCTFLSTTSLCVGAKREIWRPSVATFDFYGLLPEN